MLMPWHIHNRLNTFFFFFSSDHPHWSCNWAPKVANGAAHSLARWSFLNRFWGAFVFELSTPCFSAAMLKDSAKVPNFVGPV